MTPIDNPVLLVLATTLARDLREVELALSPHLFESPDTADFVIQLNRLATDAEHLRDAIHDAGLSPSDELAQKRLP